jgi:chromosome segregation ATPase
MALECERAEIELRHVEQCREDENQKSSQAMEKLIGELRSLKTQEVALLKSIDELKESRSSLITEREEVQRDNKRYQIELENMERILYEETEANSKSSSTVILLTRQIDEQQTRANDAVNQSHDVEQQWKSTCMANETLKSELGQARLAIEEQTSKVSRTILVDGSVE